MNGNATVAVLAMLIVLSESCFASDLAAVSHSQAATEAVANRKLANVLWEETHKACAAKDWSKQSAIMKVINEQLNAQPTNNLKYSARFVYSSCQQMLTDVSFINGACFTTSPSKHELDYVKKNWSEDSKLCDAEISNPDLSLAEPPKEQTEAEWEAEQRKNGESEEDIAFMRRVRNS
ncbi:hypothetical protein [Pseudomonas protegens]|uniref:hypothetical protein n=1 Tax=Pseudomonas protegens TaxID=380021 RepID=UPI003850CFAC